MSSIYYHLPEYLKDLLVSTVAFYKRSQKYGVEWRHYYEYLLNTSVADQELKASEELKNFLKHLQRKHSNYIIPDDLDIKKMPIIDKNSVIHNYENLITEKPFITVKSSGTSGQPLAVPYNKAAYQKEYAYWWYHRSFGGIKKGDPVATIMGHKIADIHRKKPPYWVMNYSENQLIFSSYHLSFANIPHYLKKLNDFKPCLIHSYPSSIYLIAKYILENHLTMDFRPKMIITASETTLDFQKQTIEKAFGCKNYIWYGNTEYCGNITECPKGKLHVQPYHSVVRILNRQGKEVLPGEEGYIVATNFTNTAFPLMNYNTKDVVRLSKDQHCDCGKGGVIVDYILGRIEDYIVTPDGRFVGRLDHLFKNARFVRNAQIEQNKVDEIVVRIEKEDNYSLEIEKIICSEALTRLGKDMEIKFEYVSEIPKNSNGKFKFIQQNLNLEKINHTVN